MGWSNHDDAKTSKDLWGADQSQDETDAIHARRKAARDKLTGKRDYNQDRNDGRK